MLIICKSRRNKVYYVTLKVWVKDLKKGEEGDQQIDVFSIIIQKRPNTAVHLKIDEAMEGRRSHKEVRSRYVCMYVWSGSTG